MARARGSCGRPRLRAVARVASEADDDVLAAATSLEGQLAHTYFMPFALVATSAVARMSWVSRESLRRRVSPRLA